MTTSEAPAQGGQPKDEFALVCYLPGAMGEFLDRLRTELVPDCFARSHVTLLPPRPLLGLAPEAAEQLRQSLPAFEPFEVELGEVAVFASTRVIYLELLRGQPELEAIHSALNSQALFYREPFTYHPHVTLAQGPSVVADTDRKVILARDRWKTFAHRRSFMVDSVMFVQNGGCQGWLDLTEVPVGASALAPSIP